MVGPQGILSRNKNTKNVSGFPNFGWEKLESGRVYEVDAVLIGPSSLFLLPLEFYTSISVKPLLV